MTSPPSNGEIAALLIRHGQMLEIAGESPFRSRAFSRAADALQTLPEQVNVVAAQGRLREITGVGEGIAAIIVEILATGSFAAHHALLQELPESIVELTTVPGIGAKTALKLYTSLGVDSLAALEAALSSGKIAAAKSLGSGLAATIQSGLDSLSRRTGRTPLGAALPIARALLTMYSSVRPQDAISLAGSARRWEVTVGGLDFVIGTIDMAAAMVAAKSLPIVSSVTAESMDAASLDLAGELNANIYLTDPGAWGTALVRATGSPDHLRLLGPLDMNWATEEEVYAQIGLPWIPPELRNGGDELKRTAEIPRLVNVGNVRGEFHAHTTWSDGKGTIAEMAAAAVDRGYSFLGITDHSHGLGVAGGLSPDRLLAQRVELADAAVQSGIVLLAGAEVEVHRDGSLDYDAQTLEALDVVIASLHSGLRQPRQAITARLISVLENRRVDIIAHPSGRKLERREGGDFDWDCVFDTAARTGTALEINADPARLDLDPRLAREAHAAGCLITVNCDAHHPAGFAKMEYGVAMARRAWLKPADILNCWEYERVVEWLSTREGTIRG